jgi:predicted small lipoprotein YifL
VRFSDRLSDRLPKTATAAAAVAAVLIAGLAVAGCGRRGAPEPPPGAVVAAPDVLGEDDPITGRSPLDEDGGPQRRFILDPLLD